MFLTLFRQVDDPASLPTTISLTTTSSQKKKKKLSCWELVMEFSLRVWLTFVYVLGFISRSLWVKDPKTVISGGDGVELWPRKLATARFRLDDMKVVKRGISGATINDVLFGVISAGLSRYLDQKLVGGSIQITGLALVNLRRKQAKIRWGNRFGFVLLPLHYYYYNEKKKDPLDHVLKAKEMLDRKKSSYEAGFSYWIGKVVMRWLGINAAGRLNKRIMCNTTFTISNVVGPREKVSHLGNPITYIRNNISSTPHALSLSMMSYAGQADLQILVAKDIIPDPHFLAQCFQAALTDMKANVLLQGNPNPKEH